MAVDDVFTGASGDFITSIGQIGLWLQALGLVVVLWLVFEIIAFAINRKRMKEIYAIKGDMARIEGKIDDILAKISKR